MSLYEAEHGVMPIQIRPDVIVRIHGIPWDLTAEEAQRIANVILAFGYEIAPSKRTEVAA